MTNKENNTSNHKEHIDPEIAEVNKLASCLSANYDIYVGTDTIEKEIAKAKELAQELSTDAKVLKTIFGCIDLTSLKSTDSYNSINTFVEKVNSFSKEYANMPAPAALCVYPRFVPQVKSKLNNPKMGIASVAAGFPSSQTFDKIKCDEIEKASYFGATEIDVVMLVGELIEGNYKCVIDNIAAMKESCTSQHLKVILETGLLPSPKHIWNASLCAIKGGADFIKTSTGKEAKSATLEAAVVMCLAIKNHYTLTNKIIGFKPAGGISSTQDALEYYAVVSNILGEKWLNKNYFRIGASSLANSLLSSLHDINKSSMPVKIYF